MNYDTPFDYNYMYGVYEANGLQYDSTLGFLDSMFQRNEVRDIATQYQKERMAAKEVKRSIENAYQTVPGRINDKLVTAQPKTGGRMFRVKPKYRSKFM